MELDQLGDLGDFLGGIAVIATLLYLAFQIRKQTEESRLSATRELAFEFTKSSDLIATDPELSRIYLAGIRDFTSLTDDERIRLSLLFIRNFRTAEQQYLHVHHGKIDPIYFRSQKIAFIELLAFPGVQTWWELSKELFEEGFRARIELDFETARSLNYQGSYQTMEGEKHEADA